MGAGQSGRTDNDPLVNLGRLFKPAQMFQGQAFKQLGLHLIRIEFQHAFEATQGISGPAVIEQQSAQVEVQ
jgi:hypothetical protein